MTIAHFKAPWMNEEHAMLYETAQAFFKSWQPREQRWLDNGMVDKEAWLEAGEMGFLCASMPTEYGGAGGGILGMKRY